MMVSFQRPDSEHMATIHTTEGVFYQHQPSTARSNPLLIMILHLPSHTRFLLSTSRCLVTNSTSLFTSGLAWDGTGSDQGWARERLRRRVQFAFRGFRYTV